MVRDILIIDCVATNRIVLKVKLLAAQYRVRPCATLHEARVEIDAALPDLILLDTGSNTADALEFCAGLKASGRTNLAPRHRDGRVRGAPRPCCRPRSRGG